MADIVQLKENGVFKYLKTHTAAVEGLPELLAKKQDIVAESGLITAVTSGVTPDASRPLKYWKEGRWVHMIGGGKFPVTLGQTFLVLPLKYSPGYQDEYFTATVTDSDITRKCIVLIKMTGECQILVNSYSGNPIFLNGISFRTKTAEI